MKLGRFSALLFCTALLLSGCGAREPQEPVETTPSQTAAFTRESKIKDVKNAPMFGSYGRLLFPVEDAYYSGDTLEELQLTYCSHIDPDETVEIVNTLRERAADGQTVFYDIYTDEEKAAEPAKEDTGLFFFKGVPGEKFAICNAGGAFAYVGAMQDSFPHALELSQKGYNAFALIYRPGAQTACEDSGKSHPLHLCPCGRTGSGHRLLLPMGRLGGSADGGVAGVLRCRSFWRRRSAPSRCGHHAVHRIERVFRK